MRRFLSQKLLQAHTVYDHMNKRTQALKQNGRHFADDICKCMLNFDKKNSTGPTGQIAKTQPNSTQTH